jgi:D-alanyl-lipoteichoic acid acyltransferase DltB (MBOAT superfamily)
LGFKLPQNFNSPFAAVGFSDFWKRWHISLSSWLRDYLYIPLGGNKFGKLMTARNLFITMFLGGLWHGAAWTFVLWGILHGVYLIIERGLKSINFLKSLMNYNVVKVLLMLVTMLFVMLAFVLFRANSIDQALSFYYGMFNSGETTTLIKWNLWIQVVLFSFLTLTVTQWFYRSKNLVDTIKNMAIIPKSLLLSFCLILIITSSRNSDAFIYFQF